MSHVRPAVPLFITLLITAGCATTSITSIVSPAAPSYGRAQILVVAAYSDLRWRTDVELGFQRRHPAFVASVRALDVGALNDPEAIVAHIVSDTTIEALLLIGPRGAGLSQSFVATEYYTGTVTTPWANTSATLFDYPEARIVWQADAATGGSAYSSWSEVRGSFTSKIVSQLRNDGVIVEGPPRRRRPALEVVAAPGEVSWTRPVPSPTDLLTLVEDDFNASTGTSLFERISAAVIRVEGNRGLGTAFVITRDGLALTNHHVIAGQSRLVGRFSDNRTVPIRVLRSDETSDVALIQIHCEADCFTVPIGSERDVFTGSEIYVMGHPAGLTASMTRGIVSGVRRAGPLTLLQVDAALNVGNSGGPLIDAASGRAVAVVSFKLSQAEGLGFGVAIDDALRVLGVRVR